jgi:hypothetical protein
MSVNKKLALLVAPFAIGIAACATPATTTASSMNTASAANVTPANRYLFDMQVNTTTITSSETEIITIGHAACDALDAGNSFDAVAHVTLNNAAGISGHDVGELLGRAVIDLCPSHRAAWSAAKTPAS